MVCAASRERERSYMRWMKPHLRRGRKAREKRIERARARLASRKQAA
jgi:hypothetical protein